MRIPNHLALCLLATAAPLFGQAPKPPARPNVILVLTDDQGYGELSCHGNPLLKTPSLDRLHRESIRFTDFHVAPMCTPTRGQLMTGVDCLRNRAMNVSSGRTLLRRDLPTMADLFAGAGYATGIFGKWHLGDNYPYRPQDRGFQETLWFPSSHIGSAPDFWGNDYFDDTYLNNGQRRPYSGYTTDVFFAEAIRWMGAKVRAGQPFFCYLPTAAPHAPHFVPESYRQKMAAIVAQANLTTLPPPLREQLTRYLAMIVNLDDNMARLDAFLRETGQLENTIVVFLTDNGSTFGPRYYNAGMRGGKIELYEGGHRVPLFLRWPAGGLRPGGDVAGLTAAQDLLPTLLELTGVNTPAGVKFDGVSLAPVLRGTSGPPADRTLVVQFSRMTSPEPKRGDACVLWRRWRLVQDTELYDLATDPAQQRNVIAEHPDVAAQLRAHYAAWWDGLAPGLNQSQYVIIGHAAEPESQLSPCEWHDVFLDQGAQVKKGFDLNGVWHLEVARAGDYTFELRRWPRELDLPITAAVEGAKAIRATTARIRIGEVEREQAISTGAKAVTFTISLQAGRTQMQTWLADPKVGETRGAYYVYVNRR